MKDDNDLIDLDLAKLDLWKIQTCTLQGEIQSKEDEWWASLKYGATNMILSDGARNLTMFLDYRSIIPHPFTWYHHPTFDA